ncbi:MAG: septum formation initiator family protein [Patescibacteria group bacterium]|nr:septum formation initiator family protein [Patescibacteria group bacterium]
MTKKKKSFFQILFTSSFLSLVLLIILGVTLTFSFKTFRQEREVRGQILALENEIEKVEGEKSKLLETLEYLKSDFYKEKEAREKFGMQQPGEKVIVILPPIENQEKNMVKEEENLPIFKKWWYYLFKK